MIPPRLTSAQMAEVMQDMVQVTSRTRRAFQIDADQEDKILEWLDKLTRLNVHALLRPDALDELEQFMFEDEDVRNFVHTVQFQLFCVTGTGPGFLDSLTQNLADGLAIDGPILTHNVLSDETRAAFPLSLFAASHAQQPWYLRWLAFLPYFRPATLQEFLRSNPLLITILLLILVTEPATTTTEESPST